MVRPIKYNSEFHILRYKCLHSKIIGFEEGLKYGTFSLTYFLVQPVTYTSCVQMSDFLTDTETAPKEIQDKGETIKLKFASTIFNDS